ncbi:unnamed protein product [Caenorhabditis angaria]|uniref:Ig-like domain-containing protein n=1 Tax=Caenorhabditis angaria TaxID=860376 RepID=A0A9P1J3A0_9PELO|nr:unnamed protein product [Caenorhabditis angaria]
MENTIFIILLSIFIVFVEGGEHILRLQEGIHEATTLIGVEEGSSVLIRCEHPNGKTESLRWLHGGNEISEKYLKQTKDAVFIEILKYNMYKDDGVFECSAPGMSASYRLKGEKKHILPEGFRQCQGEEFANCEHADFCQVEESTKHTSCVCEQGWMGASCNIFDTSVRSHSVVSQPICAYWPPVVTFIVFLTIIFLLAYCLYKFKVRNPHHYSKAGYSQPVLNNNTINKLPMVSGDYKPVRKDHEIV